MSYHKLLDDIKHNTYNKLYLFYGAEEYVKRRALTKVSKSVISDDFRELNHIIMDGTTADSDDIIVSCETLPFLSDKRLVVVMDYAGFKSKKEDDDDKLSKKENAYSKLAHYMSTISDTTCLIFYNRGEINKKSILYKAASKHGLAVSFDRLKGFELEKWVAGMFDECGKKIMQKDLRYFLSLSGNDLDDIHNEVQKLAAYTGTGNTIERDIIDKLVLSIPEHTIFQLLDAAATKKSGKALELLNELIENGQHVLSILSMIARQVKLMIYCKYFIDMGYSQNIISEKLKAHPYTIKNCISQSKAFTFEKLKEIHDECLKLNYGIKIGTVRDRLGLELIILNMCA